MDANSPKPPQTGSEDLSALRSLRRWLEQGVGNSRIPQVLEILAGQTQAALSKGFVAPSLDAETLQTLHLDAHGGRATSSPARWLSSSQVERWWSHRQFALDQTLRAAGEVRGIDLVIHPGGGRGNPTLYQLACRDLEPEAEPPVEHSGEASTPPHTIVYQSEPAKAAWWLRLLVGDQPVRMRSGRGYLLIGLTAAEALVLVILWLLVGLSLQHPRPLAARDVSTILFSVFITWSWWKWMQPLIRLPSERVTLAGDVFLAMSQFHGQLRLVRDAQSKLAGGWFQVVRHWGVCPECGGEVEIADGQPAHLGRLVGRCSDSPLEHVYSFDPTSMSGFRLQR